MAAKAVACSRWLVSLQTYVDESHDQEITLVQSYCDLETDCYCSKPSLFIIVILIAIVSIIPIKINHSFFVALWGQRIIPCPQGLGIFWTYNRHLIDIY
jgi:hypothetical protein